MKIRRRLKPEDIEAITLDELIEYGRQNGANIVNGMPWSFTYKATPVTHENDDLYIVGGEHFHRGDMLVSHGNNQPVPFSPAEFNEEYEMNVETVDDTLLQDLAMDYSHPWAAEDDLTRLHRIKMLNRILNKLP